MKRIILILCIATILILWTSCSKEQMDSVEEMDFQQMLNEGVKTLSPSKTLYFDQELNVTALGTNFSNITEGYDDYYFFPAIKALTNARIDVDWCSEDQLNEIIGTTLLSGHNAMPDLLAPNTFGIMDLVNDGVIVSLDEYLDKMPNLVSVLGEDGLRALRQSDGHIYSFPTVVQVPGSVTTMVRSDWLNKLNMDVPETWEEWLAFWRAIRDNDLNGNGDPTDEIPLCLQQGSNNEKSLQALLNAFGIKVSTDCQFCVLDDGTYTLVYEHPRYKEFLTAMQQLYAEGLLDQAFTTRTQDEQYIAMESDLVGTTMTWAEKCRVSTDVLRNNGVKDALWMAVAPITGPYGDQMIQQREMYSNVWSLTSAAVERGKAEDICALFDWFYSQEGSYLYSFGIEGISYTIEDGKPILNKSLVSNGFIDYRAAGCQNESFGGLFQHEAFMQCLFAGEDLECATDTTKEFYNGLSVVNENLYYQMPPILETKSYSISRPTLITTKLIDLRDQTVMGQISVEEFAVIYQQLKENGVRNIIDEATAAYKVLNNSGF